MKIKKQLKTMAKATHDAILAESKYADTCRTPVKRQNKARIFASAAAALCVATVLGVLIATGAFTKEEPPHNVVEPLGTKPNGNYSAGIIYTQQSSYLGTKDLSEQLDGIEISRYEVLKNEEYYRLLVYGKHNGSDFNCTYDVYTAEELATAIDKLEGLKNK